MALTLNDFRERLTDIKADIEEHNFGIAAIRIDNLIDILERSGIVIHAIAITKSKKVEEIDNAEN